MYFCGRGEWEQLAELSKMASREALEWLVAHGVDLEECECGDEVAIEEVDLDGDFSLYVGGYWSDCSPVIVFRKGVVARWYRSGEWG
jgi:hypothetical protein